MIHIIAPCQTAWQVHYLNTSGVEFQMRTLLGTLRSNKRMVLHSLIQTCACMNCASCKKLISYSFSFSCTEEGRTSGKIQRSSSLPSPGPHSHTHMQGNSQVLINHVFPSMTWLKCLYVKGKDRDFQCKWYSQLNEKARKLLKRKKLDIKWNWK